MEKSTVPVRTADAVQRVLASASTYKFQVFTYFNVYFNGLDVANDKLIAILCCII